MLLYITQRLFVYFVASFAFLSTFYLILDTALNTKNSLFSRWNVFIHEMIYRSPLILILSFTFSTAYLMYCLKRDPPISTLFCLGFHPRVIFAPFFLFSFSVSSFLFATVEFLIPLSNSWGKNTKRVESQVKTSQRAAISTFVTDEGLMIVSKENRSLLLTPAGTPVWDFETKKNTEIRSQKSSYINGKNIALSRLIRVAGTEAEPMILNVQEAIGIKIAYIFLPYLFLLFTFLILFRTRLSQRIASFLTAEMLLFFTAHTFAKVGSEFIGSHLVTSTSYFLGFFFIFTFGILWLFTARKGVYE